MLTAAERRAIGCALLAAAAVIAGMPVHAAAGHPAASALSPLSPLSRQYVAAEEAFRAGDLAEAEQLYSKILESHGDEPTAWFRIGLIQQRRRSFRAALNAYDSALACAPAEHIPPAVVQVLAKVRFNRALLLLDNASRDLRQIAPETLDPSLDAVRESVTSHVDAALRSADLDTDMEARRPEAPDRTAAESYVYEARMPGPHAADKGPKSTEEHHP